MTTLKTKNFKIFEDFIAGSGSTYMFSGETAVEVSIAMLSTVRDMGLDPMKTDELREGLISLFNIEIVNMPDLDNSRFILTPNHVSDFDAIVLGLLNPRIRIVAKSDWTNNAKLKTFLGLHYDLYGLDRTSIQSLRDLLTDAVNYFSGNENKHYLVFSQGTISDFNNNSRERVSSIAQKISDKTSVPILPMFVEQVSLYNPTRIIFGTPIKLSKKDDFRQIWLERERAMQSAATPPARRPTLSYKHSNNNKPGDPFFHKLLPDGGGDSR